MSMQQPAPTSPSTIVSGELFSRVYLRPAELLADSVKFRLRLGSYVAKNAAPDLSELREFLRVEGGLSVPYTGYLNYEQFFQQLPIADVLGAITLIWRYLIGKRGASYRFHPYDRQAALWVEFAGRTFLEESLGYRVDDRAGVHYFIDAEFENTRIALLSGLSDKRYAAVRDALEKAYKYIDLAPGDTKASVRSAFEALEILTRLMVPEAQNLNKGMIDKRLRPLVVACYPQATDRAMVEKLLDGFASFVDSIHMYRHGQGVEEPIAPTLEVTVYVISNAAAALRWLIFADQTLLSAR
jgi:hypothetical protein